MVDHLCGWRAAGTLLPLTALPGPFGVGDLGSMAHKFAQFLQRSGQHYWQILPLGPTDPAQGHSPYATLSAFAGNPLLISPEQMTVQNLLPADDLRKLRYKAQLKIISDRADYQAGSSLKNWALERAFEIQEASLPGSAVFQEFLDHNCAWINDYALFTAAKRHFAGQTWTKWPEALKRRNEPALREYGQKLARPILGEKFKQFIFFKQLEALKKTLAELGLGLIGDMALYVLHNSSDVWANQHLFRFDSQGEALAVSGVPPDYFSQTGQLWGHPVFDWEASRRDGHQWWLGRLRHNLGLFDILRVDHFRGFARYWEVPAGAQTAASGQWRPGPGRELFECLRAQVGGLPIIAEDLGLITPDVIELRKYFNLLGMRVLHFGFGPDGPTSCHAPCRLETDNVVFTGTHDNNTTRGWFREEAGPEARKQLSGYCGHKVDDHNVAWELTRLAYLSPAALCLIPMQDLLALPASARFNTPGTTVNNWEWRMPEAITVSGPWAVLSHKLRELGALAGRDNQAHPNLLTY